MPKAPLGFPEDFFSDGGGSGIPLVAAAAKKGKRGRQGVTNTSYEGRRRGGRNADVTRGRPCQARPELVTRQEPPPRRPGWGSALSD